jgi:hypothetical protein
MPHDDLPGILLPQEFRVGNVIAGTRATTRGLQLRNKE